MARPVGTPNLKEDKIKTIAMLSEAGVGVSKISEITGVSRNTIYTYIKKLD
jgi:transposase-like protein